MLGFPPCVLAQRPVTAVVIVEGVTWQHIEQGEMGALYVLARHGAVGLMNTGRAVDAAEGFATTLQTGRRLAPPRDVSQVRRQYSALRWLTEDLTRAGVEVQLHLEPPRANLQALLAPPPSPPSPSAQVQIWWFRGDLPTVSRGLERAIGSLNPERDRILVIGLPLSGIQLAPIVIAGSGLPTGILTSATTRTEGLVADMDIAPTLRQWHGIPPANGEHPVRVLAKEDAFSAVRALAQKCQWNAQGLIPIGILQVTGGLVAAWGALRWIRLQKAPRRAKLLVSVAIGALLSLPVGTVLASYLPASFFAQYVLNVLMAAVALSLLAHWGVWEEPFRAYVRACALSVLVIIADAVGGQYGVKSSMYSAYALSGIRFYGVGNELMGVLVGCALAWGLYGFPALLRATLWTAVTVVLAAPAWGANIGGLLTSAVGLGCAWESRQTKSQRLWIRCAGWLTVGLLAAVVVMWLDSLSVSPSHAGEAWLRWRSEGWGAVADILSSKAMLMARVLLSPFTWGVLLVIGLVLWRILRQGILTGFWQDRREEYLPWMACIGAALVFNDSGFVPAAAILGIGVGAVLTSRLQEVKNGASR